MADRSISYEFTARLDSFKAQMSAGSRAVRDFGSDLTALDRNGARMRAGLDGLGSTAGRVGFAAAAGLGAATKAAVEWESAWAGVMKTTDGTASQMAALEGELRELARTMPATHQEIAATAEAAGQLGVAREDVASFTETMVMLGETTNLTADAAATSIAQMANVMGTAPEDISRLGSALVALGNDGASTEAQIIGMAQRISGAGAQIGLTEPQILAIANATASMGIEAEAGGSAISTAFTQMAMAASSGGPKLAKFAEIAGVSTTEFQRLFKETPADAFATFAQGLDRINQTGGDVFGTLKEVGLSDIRVSQAMLSMAASGDLLADSLTLGNEAWTENSALAEEFAKRAGTTAAEVQVAWNNIRDAAIEFGTTALPILSEGADTVTAMANAFQALPGPVKDSAAAALGITAVFGGGLWFTAKTISGIASMRENLSTLGIQAGGTRTRLLALNGVKFVALGAALAAVEKGMEGAFKTRINAADLDRNLTALRNGKVSDDLRQLGDDLEILGSKTNKVAEPIQEGVRGIFGLISLGGVSGDTPMDKAADNIEAVDQALASMVESGNVKEARLIFGDLLEVIRQEGGSQRDAIERFDAYATAIGNATAAAKATAPQLDAAGDATESLGDKASTAAPLTEAMATALQEARDGAYETAGGFVNLGESLNDSEVSLGGWISELERQSKALREFERNAKTAGKKGLDEGLTQALQEAGVEGALRLEQLAGASEKEIKRANRAWRAGQNASDSYANSVEDLARQILGLPPAKNINVTADISDAEAKLARLTRTRVVNIVTNVGGRIGDMLGSADGSTVPKTGLPYADRHPYLLADGEEVISNRYGQADRWRPLLKAINAGQLRQPDFALAAGGAVGNWMDDGA